MQFAQEIPELGGFKAEGVRVPPNFQCTLVAKLQVGLQNFLWCKDVLKVLYQHAKTGGVWTLCVTGRPKNVEFFCLTVTL